MTEKDWLTAATADSAVVAELLLKLRLATTQPPSHRRTPPPPPNWTVHQRRSRTQPLIHDSNKSEASMASPSTPLSWSGGASVCGGGAPVADGVDSTRSNLNCSDISRSKVTPSHETATMRARKKKTPAALKSEEDALMEEQDHLKRKLAALQANCEKLIKENARLKKIKMDIRVEAQGERWEAIRNDHLEVVNERNDRVVLPDLNVPFEDVL